MFAFLTKLLLVARSRLKSRASLEAENLVLRQQVIVLSRKSRSRVQLRNLDRLIFVCTDSTRDSECDHRGQARNGYPVVSARLSGLLALEIAPTRRPPEGRPRDPRPHPIWQFRNRYRQFEFTSLRQPVFSFRDSLISRVKNAHLAGIRRSRSTRELVSSGFRREFWRFLSVCTLGGGLSL